MPCLRISLGGGGDRADALRRAICYRSLRLSGLEDGQDLGLTGFGASAHLVLPMVRSAVPGLAVFVFARSERERPSPWSWGPPGRCHRAESPVKLHAVIDTTPAWTPVVPR